VSRRRLTSLTLAFALAALGTAWVVPVAAATARALPSAVPASPYRFSHEVVVDEQRSGFEPDIEVGPGDVLYTSVPFGSSTGISWLWSSINHGNSFQLVPGQLAGTGRLANCPQGGGDTELAIDPSGDLFYSDLQNLTNLTDSVSTDQGATFTSNCASQPNVIVDRMWYAIQGDYRGSAANATPNFRIYEDYDAVAQGTNPANPGTNQLVMTASNNGLAFTPVVNANPTGNCLGGGSYDCVSDDEGISGNLKIAPDGNVLIAHSSADGYGIVVSRGVVSGTYPALTATWTDTTLNTPLCPDFTVDAANVGRSEICGATNFATIAEDSAGHFYVSFASQRLTDVNLAGTPTLVPNGPYEVYVASSADGVHWNAPVQVSTAPNTSNAFPWITAGSDGRVAVAWYSANETHEPPVTTGTNGTISSQTASPDPYGYLFDDLNHAEFSVQAGVSLDALAPRPAYTVTTVSEHPIKYGAICTEGLDCSVTQGDRSLGDFLQINHDARGALVLSYVDDTSNYYSVGPTGVVASSGPSVVVRQIAGPSLISGTIDGPGAGPGVPMNSVTATGEADYSANGSRTPAGDNLTLDYASLSRYAGGIIATMRVKSLSSLMVSPTAGGTTGEWIMRFTTYDPGHDGNGNIYYAGMESVLGGAPTFVVGQPQASNVPAVGLTQFNSSTAVPGTYDAKTGTISIDIPFADLGGHKAGTELYSATAFTATTTGTLSGAQAALFNQVDATPPFDYLISASVPTTHLLNGVTVAGPAPASTTASSSSSGGARGALAMTGGLGAPFIALSVALVALAGYLVRRRVLRGGGQRS
jgi:hypothetical protein